MPFIKLENKIFIIFIPRRSLRKFKKLKTVFIGSALFNFKPVLFKKILKIAAGVIKNLS